jgi:hypothetical protein
VRNQDLDGFLADADAEKAATAALVHERSQTGNAVSPDGDDEEENAILEVRQKSDQTGVGSGAEWVHSNETLEMCHDVSVLPIFLPTFQSGPSQRHDVGPFAIHQ